MLTFQRGNRLPTVAVLQAHLNRFPVSEFVAVDGIFGRKTETAIKEVQEHLGRARTGRVNYDFWARVVGRRWQILDSVDATDPDILDHEDLAPYGQSVLAQYGMCSGTPTVLNTIRATAREGEVILLRFHGHGGPGDMIVAAGTDGNIGSSLHEAYGAGFFRFLRGMRSMFSPFGSVEMHGCRVARGAPGRRLLTGMADALGVPVTAAIGSQLGGGRSTFRFEGSTRTICPGGIPLKEWARTHYRTSQLQPR